MSKFLRIAAVQLIGAASLAGFAAVGLTPVGVIVAGLSFYAALMVANQ